MEDYCMTEGRIYRVLLDDRVMIYRGLEDYIYYYWMTEGGIYGGLLDDRRRIYRGLLDERGRDI